MAGSSRRIVSLPPAEAARVRSDCTIPSIAAAAEELVLNALDAGATDVQLTIDYPRWFLSCRDNGCGISRDDLELVGERNATSKHPADRAGRAVLFGSHGEALHSLSAVSLLEIVSRTSAADSVACTVVLHLGGRRPVSAARAADSRGVGTTVSAHDVFVNRAVARKELEQPGRMAAEAESTRLRLCAIAIAHPAVAFRLHDAACNATLLASSRSDSPLAPLRSLVLGPAALLPPMSAFGRTGDGASGLAITGHATVPPAAHRTRDLQLLFVNRRPLARSSELHRLVDAAFLRLARELLASAADAAAPEDSAAEPSLPLHSAFVLFLECPPSLFVLRRDERAADASYDVAFGAASRRVLDFVLGSLVAFFAQHLAFSRAEVRELLEPLAAPGKRGGDDAAPVARRALTAVAPWRQQRPRPKASKRPLPTSSRAAVLAAAPSSLAPSRKRPLEPLADQINAADTIGGSLLNGMLDVLPPLPWSEPPRARARPAAPRRRPAAPPPEASRAAALASGARSASSPVAVSRESVRSMRVAGLWDRKFLVCVSRGTLYLLDQHAADERVQLEVLEAATFDDDGLPRPDGVGRRPLAPPRRLDGATLHEVALLLQYRDRLRAWGWELRGLDSRDGSDAILEAAPLVLGIELGANAMLEYVEALEATGGGSTLPPPAVGRVLALKACHRAVRFGDALELPQAQAIVDRLGQCRLPFICAHGRPTISPVLQLDQLPERVAGLEDRPWRW